MALSKKQIWRKTKSANKHACNALFSVITFTRLKGSCNERVVDEHNSETGMDCDSQGGDEPKVSQTNRGPPKKLKSSLSTSSLRNLGKKGSEKRKTAPLRFSRTVKVCLIPTRFEIQQFGTKLFWNSVDCDRFKREAVMEIRKFLVNQDMTAKEAIRAMYQPEYEHLFPSEDDTEKSNAGDIARKPRDIVDDEELKYERETSASSTMNDNVTIACPSTPETSGQSGCVDCVDDKDMLDESSAEEKGGASSGNIHFLSLKTDVELNNEAAEVRGIPSPGSSNSSVAINVPIKTPACGVDSPGEHGQAWMVQWQKPQGDSAGGLHRPTV